MDLPGNSSIPKTALYLLLACEDPYSIVEVWLFNLHGGV